MSMVCVLDRCDKDIIYRLWEMKCSYRQKRRYDPLFWHN